MSTPSATRNCHRVSEIFHRVGDKWTMQVVVVLQHRPHRFNDLRRQVNGISQQMLTRTLKLLERDGLVERKVLGTSPPQVEYALTPFGFSLAEPVRRLAEWASANFDALHENHRRFDANNDASSDATSEAHGERQVAAYP